MVSVFNSPAISHSTGIRFLQFANIRNPNRSRLRLRLRRPLSASMADDASASSTAKTVRVVVKGRVQGVFYRDWTMENANQLGLKGWVRNRRDGSVEALFSGELDSVVEMAQRCGRGPPAAAVTGYQVFPSSDEAGEGFKRKPTV